MGSFAFGRQEVAVDVNVARVRARVGAPLEPPPGPGGRVQPGDDGARGDGLHRAHGALRGVPAGRRLRVGREARGAARRAARRRPRFEDTNRWVRGRVVAALAAGEGLPAGIAPERLEPALEGLLRDGLVRRSGGTYALG